MKPQDPMVCGRLDVDGETLDVEHRLDRVVVAFGICRVRRRDPIRESLFAEPTTLVAVPVHGDVPAAMVSTAVMPTEGANSMGVEHTEDANREDQRVPPGGFATGNETRDRPDPGDEPEPSTPPGGFRTSKEDKARRPDDEKDDSGDDK